MRSVVLLAALWTTPALADPALVEAVSAQRSADTWTFSVTLRHGDTGWDDYADGWRIEAPDGRILGERSLLHPHETEQPFTRSQTGIAIPGALAEVAVRASTSVEGWAGAATPFTLPR